MINQLRNRNFYLLVFADVIVFMVSIFLAYAARFSTLIPHGELHQIMEVLPWLIIVKVTTFFFLGVYRGMWRYTSMPDAVRLLKATLLATLIVMTGLTFINRFMGFPRSVFIADSIFTLFFCGGIRAGIRILYSMKSLRPGWKEDDDVTPPRRVNLILIGAGDAADKIIRELQGDPASPFHVVCCLDDDSTKHHRSLLGIPIRGPVSHLKRYAETFKAEEVIIALPSVGGDRMREIVAICEK